MAAVLEYVATEVLELTCSCTRHQEDPRHLQLAIPIDKEFNKVENYFTIMILRLRKDVIA
ncbi:unnamed protein product [Meloidogyne enterolobii]|uniref:Uncharacterized protein n=1 Tax=Meloidogyne enterolobii TaxID=390850 RepID=A0ACB0ZWA3_MELEN